jgi:SAM-dependent methyltransferase
MNERLQTHQPVLEQGTVEHEKSPFNDWASFKAGKDRLRSIELFELGDVSGKSLLHLQCHFGMDTLAWARRGALVTGVDFSEKSIALARSLGQEVNIPARFVCCDIDHLPENLSGEFDIVFTSYGVLHWHRSLHQWGKIIAHFLKPDGIFYIVEDHPTLQMFAMEDERKIWDHGLGEVINALVDAGLAIDFLHEFPYAARAKFPFMEKGSDGWWRLPSHYPQIPLLFSLQTRKPAPR